jgi:hypothetical protein
MAADMLTAEPLTLAGRADAVGDWRLEQLLNAGYPLDEAMLLAALPWHQVDLHFAVDLVTERGCSAQLAARILL